MSNPLPSELREKINGILYPYHTGDLDCKCDAGCHYGSHGDVKAALVELFEQEYQRRIKAAKPDRRTLPLPANTPLMTQRWKGFNKAIDQYEHNLKQLSDGDKR